MRIAFGRKMTAGLALASALALGGCYDDGYGYGGVNVGYGGYGDGYYGAPYGYGGIGPSYGWYDNFYYPGSGIYIYDRGGTRHRWNDNQRRYWEGRRAGVRNDGRWNGRPGDRRWNGRGDGQWSGRPDDGRWNGRPGDPRAGNGRWQGRGDRPSIGQPGVVVPRPNRPDRATARASRGEGVWGAFPRAERARILGDRGQRFGGGRGQRGTPAP